MPVRMAAWACVSPGVVTELPLDAGQPGPAAGRVLKPCPICQRGRDRLQDEGPDPAAGATVEVLAVPAKRMRPVVENQRVRKQGERVRDPGAAAGYGIQQRGHPLAVEERGTRPHDKVRPLSPGGILGFRLEAGHPETAAGRVLKPCPVLQHGRDRLQDECPDPPVSAAVEVVTVLAKGMRPIVKNQRVREQGDRARDAGMAAGLGVEQFGRGPRLAERGARPDGRLGLRSPGVVTGLPLDPGTLIEVKDPRFQPGTVFQQHGDALDKGPDVTVGAAILGEYPAEFRSKNPDARPQRLAAQDAFGIVGRGDRFEAAAIAGERHLAAPVGPVGVGATDRGVLARQRVRPAAPFGEQTLESGDLPCQLLAQCHPVGPCAQVRMAKLTRGCGMRVASASE